jgi:hypothetical protein
MKNINSGVFETLIEFATMLELSAAELLFSCSLLGFGGSAGENLRGNRNGQ